MSDKCKTCGGSGKVSIPCSECTQPNAGNSCLFATCPQKPCPDCNHTVAEPEAKMELRCGCENEIKWFVEPTLSKDSFLFTMQCQKCRIKYYIYAQTEAEAIAVLRLATRADLCEQQAGVIISQEKQIQMMFTWHSNNCKDIKTLCADLDKKTSIIEQQTKEIKKLKEELKDVKHVLFENVIAPNCPTCSDQMGMHCDNGIGCMEKLMKAEFVRYDQFKTTQQIADLTAENKRLSAMIDVLTKGK